MSEATEKLTKPFAVRIDPSDHEWLRAEREANGVSVNAMICAAVRQYVRQRKGVRNRGKG